MKAFPHLYAATANASSEGAVVVSSEDFTPVRTQPPTQFGGAGGAWSPEDLMMAAIADCFCFSFRATARAGRIEWSALTATAEGELDRIENVTKFTKVSIKVVLTLPADGDKEKALKFLEKAKSTCLITNSMTAEVSLTAEIVAA